MLQLQRASAGSGKTYALAKKFIWCLITTSVEGEEPRLRSHSEIIDALPRILAITFTNKATNEMKQRIVDKLAALAAYRGEGRHPDYLDEFISQLGCPAGELSRTCAGALSALLNDYSDFKVSTIDSFFQTVLRTFAYETDISDSYQIELDNDYLAAAAIDLLFDDINHRRNLRAEYWLSHIMTRDRENGRAWNAFRRDNSRTSTYGQVLAAVMKLDNEDYKMVREALGQYLERRHDLPDIYDGFNRRISSRGRRGPRPPGAVRRSRSRHPHAGKGLHGLAADQGHHRRPHDRPKRKIHRLERWKTGGQGHQESHQKNTGNLCVRHDHRPCAYRRCRGNIRRNREMARIPQLAGGGPLARIRQAHALPGASP